MFVFCSVWSRDSSVGIVTSLLAVQPRKIAPVFSKDKRYMYIFFPQSVIRSCYIPFTDIPLFFPQAYKTIGYHSKIIHGLYYSNSFLSTYHRSCCRLHCVVGISSIKMAAVRIVCLADGLVAKVDKLLELCMWNLADRWIVSISKCCVWNACRTSAIKNMATCELLCSIVQI